MLALVNKWTKTITDYLMPIMRFSLFFAFLFTTTLLSQPAFSQSAERQELPTVSDVTPPEDDKSKNEDAKNPKDGKGGDIQGRGIFDGGGGGEGGGEGGGNGGSVVPAANEDRLSLMQNRETVNPYSSGLLGDTFDKNTGSLSFRHTDISLPTNFGIPVQFGRRYTGQGPITFH